MDNLRVVMQILDLEAGEGGRPVERFGDAWNLLQVFLAQHSDHARDLKGEIRVEVGLAVEQNGRFAIDVGKIEIVIEAAAAQRVRQFARGVGGQHDARDRKRRDRAEFGDRDLEVRQKLEQERLEFLVGAVDFVDQQHRRCLSPDGAEQRPLEQIVLGKDLRFDLGGAGASALARLDRQQLALIVPFVERRARVEPLVALHADEFAAVQRGERLGDFGLADARFALDQKRALEVVHHP